MHTSYMCTLSNIQSLSIYTHGCAPDRGHSHARLTHGSAREERRRGDCARSMSRLSGVKCALGIGREVCQVEATGPNLQGCAGSAATAARTTVCGVVWWSWLSRAVRRTATQVGLLIGGLVPGGLRSKSLKLPAAAGAQVLSWRSFDAAAVMADAIVSTCGR